MFDLSLAELMVVAFIGLMVIGPKELPAVIKAISKVVRTVKYWLRGIKNQLAEAIDDADIKTELDEVVEQGEAVSKNFIIDDAGDYREVYNIDEFLTKKPAVKAQENTQGEKASDE